MWFILALQIAYTKFPMLNIVGNNSLMKNDVFFGVQMLIKPFMDMLGQATVAASSWPQELVYLLV